MGRSRAISHLDNDDSNQSKSKKRKRIAASNLDPTSTSTTTGQGTSDVKGGIGGGGALYHCNYCNKDISGKIRIKCAVCSDFDLCIECFSVGAEITPHKTNHSYRVMDNLSFPLLCPDWNADEEILLLEAIEMYGFGNWSEVAEHVGTKKKSQCVDHYNVIYINSPCSPLPDLSHVMGKSREELLAIAKQHNSEDVKEFQAPEELTLKEEVPLTAGVKIEEPRKGDPVPQSALSLTSGSSSTTNGLNTRVGPSSDTSIAGLKKASTVTQVKDGFVNVKVEESQSDRSVGEKKPRIGNEGPSVMELSGFNFKRQEFENEYDNDAEQLLSDMEFKKTDTVAEHELKLRVLRIYNKRLEERKRRKEFILERNLLHPNPFEKNLSPEEREICQKYEVFMRFHSKEEHEELLKTVIEEHRILKKIQDLQEARAAGCRTSADAERYVEEKRKKEAAADENARRAKEGGLISPRGGIRVPPPMVLESSAANELSSSSMSAGQDLVRNIDVWDVNGFAGSDLLSEVEKELCSEMRILPSHYLNMLQNMSTEIMKGNITQKSDAHSLFKEKVESNKVDKVYDMLVMKQIAPQC